MFNLKTQKDMTEYQQTILGHLNKIEQEYYLQWYFILKSQYLRAAKAIESDTFNRDKFFNTYAKETKDVLSRNLKSTYEIFLNLCYETYKDSHNSKSSEDIADTKMKPWILIYSITESSIISASTVDEIDRTLASGIHNKLPLAAIAEIVTNKANPISAIRGNRISMTESHTGMNKTLIEGVKSIGTRFRKMWISTIDDRTRGNNPSDKFNHIDAHGQVRGLTESFDVSGEKLLFPGDPFCSPGNRINCRCVISFNDY